MASEMEKAGTVIQVDNYEEFEEKFVDVEVARHGGRFTEYFINPIRVQVLFFRGNEISEHQRESIEVSQKSYREFFRYLHGELKFDIETVIEEVDVDVSLYFYVGVPSDAKVAVVKLEREFGSNWRGKLDDLHYISGGCFVFVYFKDRKNFGFTIFADLNLPHDTLRRCLGMNYMKGMGMIPAKSDVFLEGEADSVFNQSFKGEWLGEYDKMLLRHLKKMNKVDR
jgi:hypothetical protein